MQDNHPLIETFSKAGIDWIPHDVLVHILRKASTLESKVYVLPEAELQTAIVPSASSPKKPHVVLLLANGKCKCQDCAGYSSAFVCAHTIATCVKLNRLEAFLKWLVTTKRKTGGINYSKGFSHGKPTGRGRKPNKAPRRKSKTNPPAQDNITVVPRLSQQPSCSPVLRPATQPVNVGLPQQSVLGPTSQFQGEFSIHNHQMPLANQLPYNYPNLSNLISRSYSSPERDTFVVYLLGMCPQRTSSCFGCNNSLKPGGSIGNPPADLVIVSNMIRTWTQQGQLKSRQGNVYFHCVPMCVQQKQPYFQPGHFLLPAKSFHIF